MEKIETVSGFVRKCNITPGLRDLVLLFVLILLSGCKTDHPAKDPGDLNLTGDDYLKKSDVVLSWGGYDQQACIDYGVTVWGWGPSAMYTPDYSHIEMAVDRGRTHGMRTIMGMVCETIRPSPEDASFQEFLEDTVLMNSACRDIEGNPMTPSWWDIDYGNGHRTFWNCANNPAFQDFFIDKGVKAIESGADGLFIDGLLSNRQIVGMGGCFCYHCIGKFREHLKQTYSSNELEKMGIKDVESFDYRRFVQADYPTVEQYMPALRKGEVPLLDEYMQFQMKYDTEFIKEVIQSAKKAGSKYVPAAGNACMLWPDWLSAADFLDFFVIELDFWSEPGHFPILQLKAAEALDRNIACWPIGPSVGHLLEENTPGLLHQWIALTYALGGNFMIPVKLWAHTEESGDMSVFNGDVEEFGPLYHFVSDHKELFDGYDAFGETALLYSNEIRRQWSWSISEACRDLLDRNIPFDLALLSDDYVPEYATTNAEALSNYNRLIIPADFYKLHGVEAEKEMVRSFEKSGKAEVWDGVEQKSDESLSPFRISDDRKLWVIPRKSNRDDAPLVLHIINNEYDKETDSYRNVEDGKVSISPDFLESAGGKQVKVYQPGNVTTESELLSGSDGWLTVELPDGDLWWIVEIQ